MPVRDIRVHAPDPPAALAELVPRLTAAVGPHGFVAEAAGNDWAHWVREHDDSVVRRTYASSSDGGLISITMTGASTPAEVERDVRRVVTSAATD
jgi:hypothetical protein